jgi:hypothetical protein
MSSSSRGGIFSLEPGYVLTIDNVLKMLRYLSIYLYIYIYLTNYPTLNLTLPLLSLSIQLRLRFNLPVVVMGETGAGKCILIRNYITIYLFLYLSLYRMNTLSIYLSI